MTDRENQESPNKDNVTGDSISKYRIMVVDDNKDILRMLKMGLEGSGFSIDAYSDPFTVLSVFKTIYGNKTANANVTPPPICFITAFDEYYEILRDLFPNNKYDPDICLIHKPIEIENLTTRLKHEIALHR